MAVTYLDGFTQALRIWIVAFVGVILLLALSTFAWTRIALWHAKRQARNEPQPYDWAVDGECEREYPRSGVHVLDTVPREWF